MDKMTFLQFLSEGAHLHCPNCHEDLGKATENAKRAYCSNCGQKDIKNPDGE